MSVCWNKRSFNNSVNTTNILLNSMLVGVLRTHILKAANSGYVMCKLAVKLHEADGNSSRQV
jgi:hypothetical protein